MQYYCAACQQGEVDHLPATCPACGRYMTRTLSAGEAEQVRQAYKSAARAQRERATASKSGFFAWLASVGLGAIVTKFAQWAWSAIKAFFGF